MVRTDNHRGRAIDLDPVEWEHMAGAWNRAFAYCLSMSARCGSASEECPESFPSGKWWIRAFARSKELCTPGAQLRTTEYHDKPWGGGRNQGRRGGT